jgi:predicted transcriptional regulator
MDNSVELAGQFDQMNKVVEEVLKGNSPAKIASSLGLTRVQVENHIKSWKNFVQDSKIIRERAKEALAGADEHYNMLIKEAWDVVHEAGVAAELNTKNAALKLIADIEAKRIDMLNKAGVLESDSMADQILESERKQDLLVGILKDVTAKCEQCKWEVSKRLSQVTGKVEAVIVD